MNKCSIGIPLVLTKKDFLQIEECNCGKKPFKYIDTSKNIYTSKCNYTKEEYDIKSKKWIISKKQPCDFYCVYYGDRPIFEEVKKIIIKKAQKLQDPNKILYETLKGLFRFVFVSNHTATLDEINILVKNSLKKEPRKVYYYPSPGHLRISHFELLEDYRDRIFSKKIIDLSNIQQVKQQEKPIVYFKVRNDQNKPSIIKPSIIKPSIIKPSIIKPITSKFIVVSDDESGSDKEDDESGSDNEDSDSVSFRELSDYEDEISNTGEEDEEEEEVIDEDESYENYGDDESYENYD